jgi:hypothetical protein
MKALIVVSILMAIATQPQDSGFIEGAWSFRDANGYENTLVLADGHFALAIYDLTAKSFISTRGGKYHIKNNKLIETIEFNTADPGTVGTEQSVFFTDLKRNDLLGMKDAQLNRLDKGEPGKLAGAWVITGRMTSDGLRKMTPGARRTMKILSGSRFQWIAYNVETKEFFGTGGGTYTTVDGKYTENIEFFSRDASRVGASLTFDFALEGTAWRHKGLSSKGESIDEVLTRRPELGL